MLLRRLLWTLALLLLILVGSVGAFVWLAKRAEPLYSGELALSGLSEPVRVGFGPHAVPSIQAATMADLVFAQGYVVASERMWQMDLLRRLGSGRLAELFGAEALPADRLLRIVGLAEEARRSLAAMEPANRALLDAYAAGVNAYRAAAAGRLPMEYLIARTQPAPWTVEDSLVVGAYMAWTQSFNARGELSFLKLARRIGPERARELFPTDEGIPAPEVAPEIVEYLSKLGPAGLASPDLAALDQAFDLPARFGLPIPAPASNAWAVTRSQSIDGNAMLANDPHLVLSAPGTWYELELAAPGLHAAGVSLPGVPLILIGHNQDLAWGFTTVIADLQDIYIERVTPDGAHVLRKGREPEPIQVRREQIPVRGSAPYDLVVRETHRGRVLNDILGPATGTAMDWPSPHLGDLLTLRQRQDQPDLGFQAVRALCQAKTLEEARAAGLGFRLVSTNLMLAHRDGGIAWQITGLLPERGKGSGAFPSPGWLDAYDWRGPVPQARNPGRTDPPDDLLITANNRTIPADASPRVSSGWLSPHRAQRISARIAAEAPLDPEGMARIQADRLSLQAQMMQAALRRLEPELRALDPDAWRLVETHLLPWDAVMEDDSHPAAFALMLEPALYRALYGDELGEDLPTLMSMALAAYSPLQETLRTGQSSFWDDVTTDRVETPAEIWVRAIRSAWAELQAASSHPETATLSQVRPVRFPHAFDRLPLLGRLFSVGPVEAGGSSDTVDVMKGRPQEIQSPSIAPSLRFVATPADWSQTHGTLPLGQSGHLLSPYRTDQLQDWLAVRGHPWPWGGPAEDEILGELTLTPAR